MSGWASPALTFAADLTKSLRSRRARATPFGHRPTVGDLRTDRVPAALPIRAAKQVRRTVHVPGVASPAFARRGNARPTYGGAFTAIAVVDLGSGLALPLSVDASVVAGNRPPGSATHAFGRVNGARRHRRDVVVSPTIAIVVLSVARFGLGKHRLRAGGRSGRALQRSRGAQGPFCPGTVHGAFGVHGTLHTPFLHAVPVTQSASTVQVAPGALGPKQVPD